MNIRNIIEILYSGHGAITFQILTTITNLDDMLSVTLKRPKMGFLISTDPILL